MPAIPRPSLGPVRTKAFRVHQKAFTLLELLIVFVIMSIGLTLTLRISFKFREKSDAITCRHNMRQVVVAYRLYLTTYQGQVPRNFLQEPPCCSRCNERCRELSEFLTNAHGSQSHPFLRFCCRSCRYRNRSALRGDVGWTHNLAGYYSSRSGFRPQGLGRLVAGGQIPQAGLLYCPGDTILLPDSEITGLGNSNDGWQMKYPLQTSYLLRPVGRTVPEEQASALTEPFESNAGSKALLTEITSNHGDGVHVAYVNGAIEFIPGMVIPARSFTAVGLRNDSRDWVRQGSYRFDFRLAPWIWLALDDPANAQQIIRDHPPLTGGDGGSDGDDDNDGDDGNSNDHDGDDHGDDGDSDEDEHDSDGDSGDSDGDSDDSDGDSDGDSDDSDGDSDGDDDGDHEGEDHDENGGHGDHGHVGGHYENHGDQDGNTSDHQEHGNHTDHSPRSN